MPAKGTLDVVMHPGVAEGTCVLYDDGQLEYAGPIVSCPEASGKTVVMGPADFETFRAHVHKKKH